MDLATILGLVGAAVIIVMTLILDGGHPGELFTHPAAILLTMFGSMMATTVTVPLSVVTKVPKLIMLTIKGDHYDFAGAIDKICEMADKARRDGLLALEGDSKTIEDAFLKKGIMMVVDGTDPKQVEAIMKINIGKMKSRHAQHYGFFITAGGFAPTFGIIGTVMGLISVLKQLDDPNALATSIAAAFLATLWGLLSANMIYLPIGGKLQTKSAAEVAYRQLLLEGILSIQAGENPRVIRDKLNAYLPPSAVTGEAGAAST